MAAEKMKGTGAVRAKVKVKPVVSNLSEERVVDSSSDEENSSRSQLDEHDRQTAKLSAKQTNVSRVSAKPAIEKTADTSDTSSEDTSDSDSNVEMKSPTPTMAATPAQVNGVKRKSSIAKEDSLGTEEGNDHKSKKAKVHPAQPAAASAATTQLSSLQAIQPEPYLPPRGFKKAKLTGESSIAPEDINGKMIWHISAPVGVPLTSLSKISQASISSGQPVLSHEGIDYVLVETEATESSVLLPERDGYKATSKTVSKAYTLRPAFTLPTIPAIASSRNVGSSAAANIATAAVTTIRPQPRGLKMRYKPPGFGDEKAGRIGDSSDEEEDNEESIYQFPKAVGPSTDGDGLMLGDGVAKKKKKDKKSKQDKAALHDIAPHEEPRSTTKEAPAALTDAANQGLDADGERARKKVEKKAAKKAAKLKALEES